MGAQEHREQRKVRLNETLSSKIVQETGGEGKTSTFINDRANDGKIGIDCSP